MSKRLTKSHFDRVSPKGQYLAVELLNDHVQRECTTIVAGTRAIVTANRAGDYVCVFPHDTCPNDPKVWVEGHIRVVHKSNTRPIGRVTL